jgi:two-component system response regulator AtoC
MHSVSTNTGLSVLLVDDEEIVRESLYAWLKGEGYAVTAAGSGEAALEALKARAVDLALIDLKMPGMDGIELLKRIRQARPEVLCIIVTAHGSIDRAVEAMKLGAYDFVTKPFNPEEVSLLVQRIGDHVNLIRENRILKAKVGNQAAFDAMVSCSDKMGRLFETARQVAASKATVLILGESGTGKELLAQAIHQESARRDHPFIPVSCAALSESLLEDEIFGHEKGAFTDAREERKGKFELAHRGTLFLDEIGDISPKLQLDLLRVIQEREFTRLGGSKLIRVDVRIISATNRNIEKTVFEGGFREDLYYRLNVITLAIPPLRERKEDIPLLARHFLHKFAMETQREEEIALGREAMRLLLDYPFPGNVRELEGAMEHAVILCKGNVIAPEDLPARLQRPRPSGGEEGIRSLEELERAHIAAVLEECAGNVSKASRILGIDRSTLYLKIEKYGIPKKGKG